MYTNFREYATHINEVIQNEMEKDENQRIHGMLSGVNNLVEQYLKGKYGEDGKKQMEMLIAEWLLQTREAAVNYAENFPQLARLASKINEFEIPPTNGKEDCLFVRITMGPKLP